jgi:hypothetical protein
MQDTTIMSPQTPTTVNAVMAPSSGNIELLENHTISEVVRVGHSLDMSLGLNVGPAFPAENYHKNIHIEHKKENQSHETQSLK